MCFSATGSFGVAAVVAGVGVVSAVQKKADAHRVLAATPLLFAVQQVAEGMVWRTIHDPASTLNLVSISVFLGFALVVYPIWSPLALFLPERDPTRRKILGGLLAFGFISFAIRGINLGFVLGLTLLVCAVIVWARNAQKAAVTAATAVALVGAMQVFAAVV